MSKKENQNQELWGFEKARQEREAREEAQKKSSGEKKPLQLQGSAGRKAFITVALLVVVGILAWMVSFAFGLPQKLVSPLRIGAEKISVLEYNYYYNTTYHQFNQFVRQGMIQGNAKGEIDMDALAVIPDPSAPKDLTWGEYITSETHKQIQRTAFLNQLAKAENVSLDKAAEENLQNQIDEAVKSYGSKLKAENALVRMYGRGMTLEAMKEIMGRSLLAQKYVSEHTRSLEVTDEEIEKTYNENKNRYDLVDYRSFTMSLPALEGTNEDGTPKQRTPEERVEAMAKLKEVAEDFRRQVTDEASFIEQARNFATPEEKAQYEDSNKTLVKAANEQSLNFTGAADWFQNSERKDGDVEIKEAYDRVQIFYFIRRYRDESLLPGLGRIYLPLPAAGEGEEAAAALEKAKAAAEETLEKIKGDLVDKESADRLTAELQKEGENAASVWSEVVPLSILAPEVRAWVEAPARNPGDKAVIPTAQGVELVYFIKPGDIPAWKLQVRGNIQSEKFVEKMKAWEKDPAYAIEESSLGLYFTDRLAKNTKTGKDVLAAQEKEKAKASESAPQASQAASPAASETAAPSETAKKEG